MATKRERGFFELYRDDPERADALIFGRKAGVGRSGFLKGPAWRRWERRSAAPSRSPIRCPAG